MRKFIIFCFILNSPRISQIIIIIKNIVSRLDFSYKYRFNARF